MYVVACLFVSVDYKLQRKQQVLLYASCAIVAEHEYELCKIFAVFMTGEQKSDERYLQI